MGNNFRNMVDITLTCRLFKDVEENSKKITVEINTQDLILDLLEEIYKKVELNNDFPSFGEIEATDFKLWKVEINNDDNDKFSSLVLPNDDAKNLNKLRERINDYWDDEERRPKEDCTHIIINSPRLIERRQNQDKDGVIDELREEVERLRLQIQEPADEYSYEIPLSRTTAEAKLKDLCSAKIIRVNDELWIDKKYGNMQGTVTIICKVASVDDGKLAVIYYNAGKAYENYCVISGETKKEKLPDFDAFIEEFGNDNLMMEGKKLEDISSLPDLENNLLELCGVSKEYWPKKFGHTYRDIKIVRDREEPISIEDAIKNYRKGWEALHNKK